MPSMDFEFEKSSFRNFYDTQSVALISASRSISSVLTGLLPSTGEIPISKIESRVKEREECIQKFNLKYRPGLEERGEPYAIKDHISDLVGLRIVCLYEDDIERIGRILEDQFEVISITDKIATIENTEGSFGYKGMHFDIKLKPPRVDLPDYRVYAELQFEIQVRTIVQDSWSVLDHKIKYKKSIPNSLKRRINTLAALFELADREFRQIRDSTAEEIQKEEAEPEISDELDQNSAPIADAQQRAHSERNLRSPKLNAFNFLKIASHFFSTQEFEARKVDGFVQDIIAAKPEITRGVLNDYLRTSIAMVKRYQVEFEDKTDNQMNPYTIIRHCLYLSDKQTFQSMLTNVARTNFDQWLNAKGDE
jgi:putative GTP pyrophosphokinase